MQKFNSELQFNFLWFVLSPCSIQLLQLSCVGCSASFSPPSLLHFGLWTSPSGSCRLHFCPHFLLSQHFCILPNSFMHAKAVADSNSCVSWHLWATTLTLWLFRNSIFIPDGHRIKKKKNHILKTFWNMIQTGQDWLFMSLMLRKSDKHNAG